MTKISIRFNNDCEAHFIPIELVSITNRLRQK